MELIQLQNQVKPQNMAALELPLLSDYNNDEYINQSYLKNIHEQQLLKNQDNIIIISIIYKKLLKY